MNRKIEFWLAILITLVKAIVLVYFLFLLVQLIHRSSYYNYILLPIWILFVPTFFALGFFERNFLAKQSGINKVIINIPLIIPLIHLIPLIFINDEMLSIESMIGCISTGIVLVIIEVKALLIGNKIQDNL